MSNAVWYLGPAGHLRALTVPEPGIKDTSVRYGGVHQGLSGARTVDVTGHRREYEFEWTYMEPDEWKWLKALHTRMVPGPCWLLDPRVKNRLTPQSAALRVLYGARGLGVFTSPNVQYALDFPTDIDFGVRCMEVPVFADADVIRFDYESHTPVLPGEQITCSLYAKATAADQVYRMTVDYYDASGTQLGSAPWQSNTATTSWARHSITVTPPAGTATVVFALILSPFNSPLRFAAPQVEDGATATDWEQGGGSALVHVDQLETSSPRFPLTDCSLTLLEA